MPERPEIKAMAESAKPFNKAPLNRCWAEIDLAALERNLRNIKAGLPPGVRYIAVVKADAYGHGMPEVVRVMMQVGVDCFAVANVQEAMVIRHMGGGWPILLLSPLLPEEYQTVVENQLIATVNSAEEAESLSRLACEHRCKTQIHLKIDTGMGRAGIWYEEAETVLREITALESIELTGIYTHFCDAEKDAVFTEIQRSRLLDLANSKFLTDHDLLVHADNSAGILSSTLVNSFRAARVGLLQYGISPKSAPLNGPENPVAPTFSFHSRLGLIKRLPAGTTISYGRTFRLERETTIGIVTAGYGDGVPIALSNRFHVLINGVRCPIIGRVTMDQTVVNLGNCSGAKVGDQVTLIGCSGDDQIQIEAFSEAAQTIPWDTLCSVTKRVPRIYRNVKEF